MNMARNMAGIGAKHSPGKGDTSAKTTASEDETKYSNEHPD